MDEIFNYFSFVMIPILTVKAAFDRGYTPWKDAPKASENLDNLDKFVNELPSILGLHNYNLSEEENGLHQEQPLGQYDRETFLDILDQRIERQIKKIRELESDNKALKKLGGNTSIGVTRLDAILKLDDKKLESLTVLLIGAYHASSGKILRQGFQNELLRHKNDLAEIDKDIRDPLALDKLTALSAKKPTQWAKKVFEKFDQKPEDNQAQPHRRKKR